MGAGVYLLIYVFEISQCLLPGFASKLPAGRQDIQLCLMTSQA